MNGWMPDGTPITPETWKEFANVLNAESWFAMLASPRLWSMLRRIPPKAFLIELLDAYLVYAKSGRHYAHDQEGRRRPDLSLRSKSAEHLRELLIAWEPPTVTPEIREAARTVSAAEYGETRSENWDDPEHDPPTPLEATLIWPEGEWDENAFVAVSRGLSVLTSKEPR